MILIGKRKPKLVSTPKIFLAAHSCCFQLLLLVLLLRGGNKQRLLWVVPHQKRKNKSYPPFRRIHCRLLPQHERVNRYWVHDFRRKTLPSLCAMPHETFVRGCNSALSARDEAHHQWAQHDKDRMHAWPVHRSPGASEPARRKWNGMRQAQLLAREGLQ